jgi:hypothetical protein
MFVDKHLNVIYNANTNINKHLINIICLFKSRIPEKYKQKGEGT